MVARSGSGKTATVVGLAKKHFVIYLLYSMPGSNLSDFRDTNFDKLAQEVEDLPSILKPKYHCKSEKSALDYDTILRLRAMDRVKLEYLARQLHLLFLFQTILTMIQNTNYELKKFLHKQGLVIVLDEAHVVEDYILYVLAKCDLIYKIKNYTDIFNNNGVICSEYCCGFLTSLIEALDGMGVTLVVLGTAFSLLNVEHIYSTYCKPDEKHLQFTNFPSANEEDVDTMLNLLLDMSNCVIPLEKKQRLAGRFQFTIYIIEAITQVNSPNTKSKQTILNEAIILVEKRAKGEARSDVKKLLNNHYVL
ncbi:hypothetical protein BC937DRAFT_95055 [Endogone sp. FLAS-F59071]|nr:hypothetical protein BC937DRAFT_95055 [Endogone sp. FLAS-F59071]|eukprot:RUS13610.1 hypothetical protein BC937DRAFT_95055 [Endogone sp. FLAS-F59071]